MYDLCLHRLQPPRFDFQSVHFGSNAFENTYYGASLYSDAYIYGHSLSICGQYDLLSWYPGLVAAELF